MRLKIITNLIKNSANLIQFLIPFNPIANFNLIIKSVLINLGLITNMFYHCVIIVVILFTHSYS